MNEGRLNELEKIEKRLLKELDRLKLLTDAELYRVLNVDGSCNVTEQLSNAQGKILLAVSELYEATRITRSEICENQMRMEQA